MVVSIKQFLKATNSLSITLESNHLVGEILSVEYQNISYYFEVIYRCQLIDKSYLYTLKPTYNTNFQLL